MPASVNVGDGVHVQQLDTVEVGDRGIDVAGHGDVDDEQSVRHARPPRHRIRSTPITGSSVAVAVKSTSDRRNVVGQVAEADRTGRRARATRRALR